MHMLTYAYADVCWRMLKYAVTYACVRACLFKHPYSCMHWKNAYKTSACSSLLLFSADYFSIVYRLPHFNNTSYYKADSSIHPHPDSDLQTLQWLLLLFLLDRIADILCLLGGEYFVGLLWNSHFFVMIIYHFRSSSKFVQSKSQSIMFFHIKYLWRLLLLELNFFFVQTSQIVC